MSARKECGMISVWAPLEPSVSLRGLSSLLGERQPPTPGSWS